jgi:DnaJ-class molecular chaperone
MSVPCPVCNEYGRLPLGSVRDGSLCGWTECPRCKGTGKIATVPGNVQTDPRGLAPNGTGRFSGEEATP